MNRPVGRGRHGRRWLSEAGKSLLLSIVLPQAEAGVDWLQEEVALATAQTLRQFIGSESVVKAPNDVISRRRRKLAGVLIGRASTEQCVAGIAINVAQDVLDWPQELRGAAESLRTLGVEVRRSVLAGALIEQLRPLILGHFIPYTTETRRRRASSTPALTRVGNLTVRVDGEDHSGIWTRRKSQGSG
jgi:biotin-(acetyl-CoA carboxylase) ligase